MNIPRIVKDKKSLKSYGKIIASEMSKIVKPKNTWSHNSLYQIQ